MFDPAYFDNTPGDQSAADLVISQNATDAEIDAAAQDWAWRLPLRIWTPSEDDPRFLRFIEQLAELGNEGSYSVWVKPPMVVVQGAGTEG